MLTVPDRRIAPLIKDAIEFNLLLKPCEQFALKSGAPVYFINDGSEEVALLEFVFFAGTSFEEKNMVATATNFLVKNGTSRKTAFEINEHFDYHGAYLSRSCNNEIATITLHCLSRHLRELLPAIREIITDSIFPQYELEIFQQNSIQKLVVQLQKCDFVANRLIDKYLYGEHHPYGKITEVNDINAVDREDLVRFFNNFYLNGRCCIFAAGKLPGDFIRQLSDQFGDLNLNAGKPLPLYEREPGKDRILKISNDPDGVQGAIRIARPFPTRHHPDYNNVKVLNVLFGGYFSSRLMANIREAKGYTYGIYSYLENHLQESAWVISTEAGRDVCDAAINEVYEEMKILREEMIDDEELLLVKNYMMGLNLGNVDGPFKVIARWKDLIIHGMNENNYYEYINTIKRISSKEMHELANKYLVPEDFFELVVI